MPDLRFVVGGDAHGFARHTDGRLGEAQVKIALSRDRDAFLAPSFQRVVSRLHELLGRKLPVDRLAQIQLAGQRGARGVSLFAHRQDISLGGLNSAVVAAIRHARGQPRKKLEPRALIQGSGFGQPLLGDLHVQILRAGQPQCGGQVNEIR